MSEFGAAQQIDVDPVGTALATTHHALISLRETAPRTARRLTAELEQIAAHHTSGILSAPDTIHALAGLVERAVGQHAS